MNIIKVEVGWTGDNFCCSWDDGQNGIVLATAKTLDKLKADCAESIRLHIQGCIADGDKFPEYLANGDYEIEYNLDAAADKNVAHKPHPDSIVLRARLPDYP